MINRCLIVYPRSDGRWIGLASYLGGEDEASTHFKLHAGLQDILLFVLIILVSGDTVKRALVFLKSLMTSLIESNYP